jgi:oligopeptide transport system ATP-binding protein
MSEYILEVNNLNTSFHTQYGEVMAVNGVSFGLKPGKVLGIVGESGSGKSVTAYSIMHILSENGSITSGEILYKAETSISLPKSSCTNFAANAAASSSRIR